MDASFSVFPWSDTVVKAMYQVIGFVVAGATIGLSVRAKWKEGIYLGAAGMVVLLYTKFYQWWWDWMPAYLFFLIVGVVAIAMILLLRRLRAVAEVTS